MTRIVYAFRNKVWPKPTEGLDLFTPVIDKDDISESSEEDEEDTTSMKEMDGDRDAAWSGSDVDFGEETSIGRGFGKPQRASRPGRLAAHGFRESFVTVEDGEAGEGEGRQGGGGGRSGGDGAEGGERVRNFEIGKTQGLKMTFKKTGMGACVAGEECPLQVGGVGLETGFIIPWV